MSKRTLLNKFFKYMGVDDDIMKDYIDLSLIILNEELQEELPAGFGIMCLLSGYVEDFFEEELLGAIEECGLDIELDPDDYELDLFLHLARYSDWKDGIEEVLDYFNDLIEGNDLPVELEEEDFKIDGNMSCNEIRGWSQTIANKLYAHGYSVVLFYTGSDGIYLSLVETKYVDKLKTVIDELFEEYEFSASFITGSISNSNGENIRCFECYEGDSSKFWNISWDETSYTVTYGKIGTDGSSKTKETDDVTADVEKLIKSKIKKGYYETNN